MRRQSLKRASVARLQLPNRPNKDWRVNKLEWCVALSSSSGLYNSPLLDIPARSLMLGSSDCRWPSSHHNALC